MAERADDQLSRILYMLPAAAQAEGIALDVLAQAMGVDAATIHADMMTIAEREYYHPAGSVQSMSIFLDDDKLRVMGRQNYERPVRLSEREALALGLGLRVLASECSAEERPRVLALASLLESSLAAPGVEELAGGTGVEYDRDDDVAYTVAAGDDAFRGVLTDAAASRRWCTISYLKPGDQAPQPRRIAPYQLVHAEGAWYIIAHDASRHAVRTFRLDRILDVNVEESEFDRPDDFDPAAWVAERGAPYVADDEIEVPVRYSSGIARWIREHAPAGAAVAAAEEGAVRVRHRVSDRRWIVRHVLQYGGDAVVENGPCRSAVYETARRIARG